MNILVIGNGFDLAHDLPTSYSDVLNFLQAINITSKWRGEKNEFINTHLSNKNFNSYVSDYIINAFDSRTKKGNSAFKNSNPIIQELYDNLDNNIRYTYLWDIYSMGKMKGINWIDFEGEISHIIERIDKEEENIYLPFRKITSEKDEKINIFFSRLPIAQFYEKNISSNEYNSTFRNFLDISYSDLRRLVRCIEIYLTECVETIPITKIAPNIMELTIHKVLNFNYTHTFTSIYPPGKATPIHYLHGETRSSLSIKNNMVLGIDEYYRGTDKDNHTNYNIYKKFTQRIINETGFLYRSWIKSIDDNYQRFITKVKDCQGNIYIFGHSLDVTDKDVLKDLIDRSSVQTTIFYHDKQQQAQQIANLTKMLGQDHFIEMINQVPPQIKFEYQKEMVPITDN